MRGPSEIEIDPREVAELLQALIRNACVNTGQADSGQEHRNAQLLVDYLSGCGMQLDTVEPYPGRMSLIARLEGKYAGSPRIAFISHTDVVPADPDAWRHDPFGGELIDGEVWGRGAIDMLGMLASQAVTLRSLARAGVRPDGDLVLLAAADEEALGNYGARQVIEQHWDLVACDYALTEIGGLHTQSNAGHHVSIGVAEKGYAWRRLTVHGTPGHGGMPHAADNALIKAAEVIRRLTWLTTPTRLDDLWRERVRILGLPAELEQQLLDPDQFDIMIESFPAPVLRGFAHACGHTTISPNVITGGLNANTIPSRVTVVLDNRVLAGDTPEELDQTINDALGDLTQDIEIDAIGQGLPNRSPIDTPMWDALRTAVRTEFPRADLSPALLIGLTDGRWFRRQNIPAYGAGLFVPTLTAPQLAARFHGHDERIDLESLRLSTRLWLNVIQQFTGRIGH